MIVCLCRRVSDRDIRRAVQQGVDNFEALQDDTGVASHCGCCHDCARDVFDEARNACGKVCSQAVLHAPAARLEAATA